MSEPYRGTLPSLPNAPAHHGQGIDQLREQLRQSGRTVDEIALLAGVATGTIERYLQPIGIKAGHVPPYPLQYVLEAIAAHPPAVLRPRKRKREGVGANG